jgi:hypothetical protein
MSLQARVDKLEEAQRLRCALVAVEDLTDEQLEEMVRKSGYDLTLLTDAELNALHDCYTDAGDYIPERMTQELAVTLERVKL